MAEPIRTQTPPNQQVPATPPEPADAPAPAPAKAAARGRRATKKTATDIAESPMMRQYKSLKAQHPDKVLFFRMGDFYEMFFDDAHVASRVLGIALTSRSKGDQAIPMAGVPCVAATGHVARLLKAGHRVAIAEQIEDASQAKGLVDRAVTEVVTPGTLTDERLLTADTSNFLLAACPARGDKVAGLAWLDLSTGRFRACDVPASAVLLRDEIARIAPAECLVPEGAEEGPLAPLLEALAEQGGAVTTVPAHVFNRDDGCRRLRDRLGVASLDGFGVDEVGAGLGAAGAILRYVDDNNPAFLETVRAIERHDPAEHVRLDRSTLRGLEIIETARERERRGSLLGVMDRTRTPPGARLIREWLAAPLRDPAAIRARHEAVAALHDAPRRTGEIREELGRVGDLERLATRLAGGRGGPRDLAGLRDGLERLPALRAALEGGDLDLAGARAVLLEDVLRGLDPLEDLSAALRDRVTDDPPSQLSAGGVIRDGVDAELDEARSLAREGRAALAKMQEAEVERTGIPLKVGYNRVFGYYLEVTNSHKSKVPSDWIRRQTLKNAERYVTDELKAFETRVVTAKERAAAIEERLVRELRELVGGALPRVLETSRMLATLDVLGSFAHVARERRYCRPTIDDGPDLRIVEGRHPVLDAESATGERFVGNDVRLSLGAQGDPDAEPRLMVITGPNMAGKSTYIRQTALIVILAQAGSFVPADEAHIGVCDRVFARVGAADDLARGLSTFMVEMTEAALILNHATDRSLLVLDEVGRGTSTFDGVAIAWAIAEHLHDRIGARTLFATHYHELVALEGRLPGAAAFNVAVREWQGEIVFLRKVVRGGADRSYGVHVARLAGVPAPVLERARGVLESLEAGGFTEAAGLGATGRLATAGAGGEAARRAESAGGQLSLFRSPRDGILDEMKAIEIDHLSPIDALLQLRAWREQLAEDG